MPLRSLRYVVSGLVQGVNFRHFLKRNAKQIGVVGWTQNDAYGNVVGVAQGEEDRLEKFKQALRTGPPSAKVTDVKITEEKTISKLEHDAFEIRM